MRHDLTTARRREALLALTWNNVDFRSRQVHVRRSRVALNGGQTQIGAPKTRRGHRTIVLPHHVFDQLSRLRTLQLETFGLQHVRDGFVVVDQRGKPLRPERWSDAFTALASKAGIVGITLHAARHNAVTRMRSHGAKDHAVAQFLGHDEVVMRNTYTHSDFEGIVEAGELLLARADEGTREIHR